MDGREGRAGLAFSRGGWRASPSAWLDAAFHGRTRVRARVHAALSSLSLSCRALSTLSPPLSPLSLSPPPISPQSNLSAGTDALLALEKAGRLAEDAASTTLAVAALLSLLKDAAAWPQLNETVLLLAKRRGQLKGVIQALVRQAAGFVDAAPDPAAQAELMKTLLAVTEGRIYVEIDRARLTRRLAAAREAAGDPDGAGDLLQEVAVETFGAMAKSEKIDFILEQVRLCLDRGDFVRSVEKRMEREMERGVWGRAGG